ncbi:MAG: hypothetical protein ABI609_02550 [Acidobacteriota bacterium]
MICPERSAWRRKLAHRFDAALDEPAEWALDRVHLETCPECRQDALEIDPTLLFQRLPVVAAPAVEIERMRAAVAGLRRANALQAAPPATKTRLLDGAFAWRAAAAVLLVTTLGSQVPLGRRSSTLPAAAGRVIEAAAPAPSAAAISPTMFQASGLLVPGEVGRPQARVYEIGYPEMSVVMIVDKSLVL